MRGQGIRLALCLWLAANASGLSADTHSVMDLHPDVRSDSVIYGDNRDNEGPVYQLDYVCFVQWTRLLPSRYCLGPVMTVTLDDEAIERAVRVEFQINGETQQLDLNRLGDHTLEQGERLYQALIANDQRAVPVTAITGADNAVSFRETVNFQDLESASSQLTEVVDQRVEEELHKAYWFVLTAYGLFAGMLLTLTFLIRKWWRRGRGKAPATRRQK